MNRKIEILAPAGSYESLKAAICAGADAIYVGGIWRRMICFRL